MAKKSEKEKEQLFTAVKAAFAALDDKMAEDIQVLDIGKISVIADYFIIASGSSPAQLKAMAEEVEEALYKTGYKLNHSEGSQSKEWVLLDFGDIVVHLFGKESRQFYNIERNWGDAVFISEEELKK
jgi:ribosome-associated protein